jgi:hypothetical protein
MKRIIIKTVEAGLLSAMLGSLMHILKTIFYV